MLWYYDYSMFSWYLDIMNKRQLKSELKRFVKEKVQIERENRNKDQVKTFQNCIDVIEQKLQLKSNR